MLIKVIIFHRRRRVKRQTRTGRSSHPWNLILLERCAVKRRRLGEGTFLITCSLEKVALSWPRRIFSSFQIKLRNCFEWILLSTFNCADGCPCTNLRNSDKQQIQNETKTIYCILLIIFFEESWGEEGIKNKHQQTTTNLASALWILPAVSLALLNLLLCLLLHLLSSSPIQFSYFFPYLKRNQKSHDAKISKKKLLYFLCNCPHELESDKNLKSTGWWITDTLITASVHVRKFQFTLGPSLIDDSDCFL